jgi:hypothetical protein
MKRIIFVFLVAALFIGTTFAGASATRKMNEVDAIPSNPLPYPCPIDTPHNPGIVSFAIEGAGYHYEFFGLKKVQNNFIEVKSSEEVTYEVNLTFGHTWESGITDKIELTISETSPDGTTTDIIETFYKKDYKWNDVTYEIKRTYTKGGLYQVSVKSECIANMAIDMLITINKGPLSSYVDIPAPEQKSLNLFKRPFPFQFLFKFRSMNDLLKI